MSKTADVLRDIWAEDWFQDLAPDGQHLYLWAITCPHTNPAGLFIASRKLMTFETNLRPARLDGALTALARTEKLLYDEASSVVWVRGQARRIRSKSGSMARSVASAWASCPSERLRVLFAVKYADVPWLRDEMDRAGAPVVLADMIARGQGDYANPSGTPVGVPSQGPGHSPSLGTSVEKPTPVARDARQRVNQDELPDTLPAPLHAVAAAALEVMERVYADRGGQRPTLRGVGLALAAFPERAHLHVAGELEHWATCGNGATRDHKDLVRLYRTFLGHAPVGSEPRPGTPDPFSRGRDGGRQARNEERRALILDGIGATG